MKNTCLFIFFLGLYTSILAQKIGINGGLYPSGLKGSHFGSRVEFSVKEKWQLGVNYQMVKYTDIFALPNFAGKGLHKEYKQDETIVDFEELDRGFPVQNMELDFRPRDLNHSFALLLRYLLFSGHDLSLNVGLGPHFKLGRTYVHAYSVNPATIQLTEDSQPIELPYFDYEIFRFWDIGSTIRIDLEYSIFENVSIGMMIIAYIDLIDQAGDLSAGISLNYNFSN